MAGGGIYIKGSNAKIIDSNFTLSNSYVGGVIYVNGTDTVINGSSFKITHAGLNGGAIYVQGDSAIIEKSVFAVNNVTGEVYSGQYRGHGGAIYIQGDYVNIIDSNFTTNQAILGSGGAIYVGGINTTISGANLASAQAPKGQGGAIYVNGINAVIEDSSIYRAHSGKEGGAIYLNGANADIKNTNISYTSSDTSGGAVYIKAEHATIEGSHFSKNNATVSGGGVYIDGKYASILNTSFKDDIAISSSKVFTDKNLGGAIYIAGYNSNISGSSFDSSSAYDGGAIYSYSGSYSTLYNCNFTNNKAQHNGGGIYWHGGKNDCNYNSVIGCLFINNSAYPSSTSGTVGGGGIYWSEGGSHCSVRDSTFINNSVHGQLKAEGGGILWDKSTHGLLDNCVFDGNYITSVDYDAKDVWVQGGALFLRTTGNFTVTNSLFKNCWSDKECGAAYIANTPASSPLTHDITLINLTFINNTAKAKDNNNVFGGGAIQIKESKKVYGKNLTFINNTANRGGALTFIANKDSTNELYDCTFIGNTATEDGGSIYIDNNFKGYNFIISDSSAGNRGGGIYALAISGYSNWTFINNTAFAGGGLYWDHESITINGMKFINNTASRGGGIYIPKSNTVVSNNNFTGNSALMGGAIYVDATNANIKYNNFTKNTAEDGGAIYLPKNDNYRVSITYSNFEENHATINGGAIYNGFRGDTNKYITNCNFIKNSADENGGAIYLTNYNQKVLTCTFDQNTAVKDGGSIYVGANLLSTIIQDSTFTNSHAANGGAIYNEGSTTTTLQILNDTFIKNIARYNGGAVLYKLNNGAQVYRDYNNFDGKGIIDGTTKRTDLFTDTGVQFIKTSLFEDNEDYLLHIITVSDWESPVITVRLSSPNDPSPKGLQFIVNLYNSTTGVLIKQINVTEDNFNDHYNQYYHYLYVTFDENLTINGTYNISVTFTDENYMIKGDHAQETAHGEIIGEFQLLQRQIQDALNRNETQIILNRTYRFTPEYQGIKLDDRCINLTNISGPFTIIGNGWAIDARGYSRIFNITAANITLIDVQLSNGNASGKFGDKVDKGGGIYWVGENGTLINVYVYKNNAYTGGGIYFNTTASNCSIINSTFINNTAVANGGAIDCNSYRMELINTTFNFNRADYGAALCREVNATNGTGYNNIFRNNYAVTSGAALAWINATSISIDRYFFYDNYAGKSGGAIYVGNGSGNCEIKNSVFENNYVTDDGGNGGAIEWYAKSGLVLNSTFSKNHGFNGGAIYVAVKSSKTDIIKSTFSEDYVACYGGAISKEVKDTIKDLGSGNYITGSSDVSS